MTVFRHGDRHCRCINSGRLAASRNALFVTRFFDVSAELIAHRRPGRLTFHHFEMM